MDLSINMMAVLVGGIVTMVIGALWYSPALFAKVWMKETGITEDKMKMAQAKGMGKTYLGSFIASLVLSYVLAHFVAIGVLASGLSPSFSLGAQIGGWIWLGFIATSFLNTVFWEGKSWTLYFINAGHYLAVLVLVGGILGTWQ